jgi:hypothetical protein
MQSVAHTKVDLVWLGFTGYERNRAGGDAHSLSGFSGLRKNASCKVRAPTT